MQRDDLAVDLGADAAVPDVRMDLVGEVERRRAGRELLHGHLKKAGLPSQKIVGSALLADVIREMGFKKADDFYIALGGAKISTKVVVKKVMDRLRQGEAAEEPTSVADDLIRSEKKERGPSRDWLALAKTTRAQSKIRAWFKRERREDSERSGRLSLIHI